jgi:hypothetical protein
MEQTTTETENITEAPKVETDDFIENGKRIVSEIRAGLEARTKLLEREEKLLARQEALRAMGGGSITGQKPAEIKIETAKEYAERVMNNQINTKE